jgi:UDP-glucose 4-epimerase
MAVAVIGGAGFIGSNLVDELLAQGHEVTVLDDLSEGKLANLERWRGERRLEFVKGDIRDYNTVRRVVDHKGWVFHLAAMSRIQPSITDPLSAFQINMMGTANVLEACRKAEVQRVVYSASSSAYGDHNAASALVGRGLHEGLAPDCGSPYSLSKFTGEEICAFYNKFYKMSTVSLRYFNVYGPRHQETGSYATVIAIFRKQKRLGQPFTVVGDGTQRRDFTFVGDVVRANMMAAMNREATGLFNIGTGENYSINELAEIVGPGHPVEFLPPRQGEYRVTRANVRLAADVLGWKPTVTLDQGLNVLDEYERRASPLILVAS